MGATCEEVLERFDNGCGYGRKFLVQEQELSLFVKSLKENLNAKNVCVFGENKKIKKVASFCGAGLDEKTLALCDGVDVIVSSDIKHHVLTQAVNSGKCVVMPTHYATENYGFKKIALLIQNEIKEKVLYFEENVLI